MWTRRQVRGFTLVELLVSVGLTALLSWGVVTLYSAACRLAATATLEAELTANGRAALDLICRDLMQAAGPEVGYLCIEAEEPWATVRFVAPTLTVGAAHVAYQVRDLGPGRERMLCRCLKRPVTSAEIPADGDYNEVSPLGVNVEELTVEHVGLSGSLERGGNTWQGAAARYPRSVLVTVRVADARRGVSLVVSSGAVLLASGF
ncbi:MAG TPA: prepilin-type N-terminal cleavage/methylation domain-containing protein [Planctomycetota bacterium]|nr:prepilin-type N-terminal cleavage/methylation domain-containing protein [Planctomycetota bacterium]HRR83148.1 prepilin-type N-terminal cleavage/methylation domain-containing protein [Planctomycetota bacterium]HRT97118.1 prepilin-type N-terminal cleavage/methylation domain-containing protein [Planctomycetota bacterium]